MHACGWARLGEVKTEMLRDGLDCRLGRVIGSVSRWVGNALFAARDNDRFWR